MIDNQYEFNKALQYISIIFDNNTLFKSRLTQIHDWHSRNAEEIISFTWLSQNQDDKYGYFDELYKKAPKEALKIGNNFKQTIRQLLVTTSNCVSEDLLDEKLIVLQQLFALSEQEKSLLEILICYKTNAFFEEFVDDVYKNSFSQKTLLKLCCQCLQTTPKIIKQLTSSESKLVKNNLLENNYDYSIECSDFCVNLLEHNFSNQKELKQVLLKTTINSELGWQDFEYIKHINLMKNLFNSLKQIKKSGINILLHGEIGTGKTEFAKILCQETDFTLYEIEGNESLFRNSYRFDTLLLTQHLLSDDHNSCLLIDEADDVLCQTNRTHSKLDINKILEYNSTPVIWIMNDISDLDHAYLRRFSYIFEFTKPSETIRQKIWRKILGKYHFDVSESVLLDLAKNYQLQPALIESAVKTTWQGNGGIEEVEHYIELQQKAFDPTYSKPNKLTQAPLFFPSLVNSDINVLTLTERLKEHRKLNFSLCLYGASGTGKSAYAHYLAQQLSMPIVKKQGADILSMWVGGTEKNIVNAFKEAEEQKAILLIDEADSFLQNRQSAQRSWEITQVNQMLTCMESHQYPFICTTNLMESLDYASLRRFTFKIKYDFMTLKQMTEAFQFFFDIDNIEKNILKLPKSTLSTITVGDFMVVKNKAGYLECLDDADELIELLLQEQVNKPKPISMMGFS